VQNDFPRAQSDFPSVENDFIRMQNNFSCVENDFPHVLNGFPCMENEFPRMQKGFPRVPKTFPHRLPHFRLCHPAAPSRFAFGLTWPPKPKGRLTKAILGISLAACVRQEIRRSRSIPCSSFAI
jgi:hypothetical protein